MGDLQQAWWRIGRRNRKQGDCIGLARAHEAGTKEPTQPEAVPQGTLGAKREVNWPSGSWGTGTLAPRTP